MQADDLSAHIAGTPLSALHPTELARVAAATERKTFVDRKGSVWRRDGCADALLLVVAGRFRVLRSAPARGGRAERTVLFRFAEAGELLGHASLVGGHRTAEVVADGRAVALVIDAAVLRAIMAANVELTRGLLGQAWALVDRLTDEVVRLRTELFVDRLIARIEQHLAEDRGALRLTQRDLAQMVGGSAPEVARATRAFANVMSWEHGALVVHDLGEARRLLRLRDSLADLVKSQ